MKKKIGFLLLPLLLPLSGCQTSIPSQGSLLHDLMDGFHVSIEGNIETVYPEGYEILNTNQNIIVERDYKNIVEEDGTITPAVREQRGTNFTTLFRGENGETVYELLTKGNEVEAYPLLSGGNPIVFNDVYGNPFTYLEPDDIDEQLILDSAKASFVLKKLTGYSFAVQTAQFRVKNNKVKGLDVMIFDRVDGLQTVDGMLEIVNHISLQISFAQDVDEITHLLPRKEADKALQDAFLPSENYTMTFESNATADNMIVYATEEAILLHHQIHSFGYENGDIYYKKTGEDCYDKYVYQSSTHTFSLQDFDVKKRNILPDLSNVSPNILVQETKDSYRFDAYSAPYGMEDFILPAYAISSGIGVTGVLRLDGNHFSSLHAYFDASSFSITQNYYNYDMTTMPSWFDASLIR